MSKKTLRVILPLLLTLVLAVILCPSKTEAAAVGTAFTYQGQLLEAGSPANGSYDFQFSLYDAESGLLAGNRGQPGRSRRLYQARPAPALKPRSLCPVRGIDR